MGEVCKLNDYIPSVEAERELSFDPGRVFYDSTSGKYLVDVGTHFRCYTRKSPVVGGVARWLRLRGANGKEAIEEAKAHLADAEIDRAVDWAGAIAGHRRGIFRKNGIALLVTTEADLPDPTTGQFPVLSGILRDAFEAESRTVFCGWLAGAFRSVRAGVHSPAPMLVLAGEVNSGKSLLAWIAAQVLGGRVGHPFTAWSGTLPWNDDLVGAELLLIDDNVGSTDMRKRKEFGASFKEAIYGAEVQVNRRHATAMSLRPCWRVMVACNDTPESLGIIPPLDDDLDDKVALLRVRKVKLPVDASTPEGKTELQRLIRDELSAFVGYLDRMTIPDHLRDTRAGVMAWRDPELSAALDGIDEGTRFAELLRIGMKRGAFNLSPGESIDLPAAEIEAALCDTDSPVRDQARALLSRHHTITGRLLGKLARHDSEIVAKGGLKKGLQQWTITKPSGVE